MCIAGSGGKRLLAHGVVSLWLDYANALRHGTWLGYNHRQVQNSQCTSVGVPEDMSLAPKTLLTVFGSHVLDLGSCVLHSIIATDSDDVSALSRPLYESVRRILR